MVRHKARYNGVLIMARSEITGLQLDAKNIHYEMRYIETHRPKDYERSKRWKALKQAEDIIYNKIRELQKQEEAKQDGRTNA